MKKSKEIEFNAVGRAILIKNSFYSFGFLNVGSFFSYKGQFRNSAKEHSFTSNSSSTSNCCEKYIASFKSKYLIIYNWHYYLRMSIT